ncbi:MAG: response regulator transcription factor [Wenzhouxiangella sp.]|nr:response regulator transcription factor [Wenzhouxiangella sp.]
MSSKILIIDDDRELAGMLADYLATEGLQTGQAHDGPSGREAAQAPDIDAVVLDVMLPGMNGFDLLRKLRGSSRVPVIMLTARGEDTDRIVGLELGADDYLPKPFNPRELGARLRAVLRRARSAPEPTEALGELSLDHARRRVSLNGEPIDLTAAEFAVLERLLSTAGEVVAKDELALHALGRTLQPFERSIDTHVSRLRGKLGPLPDGQPRIEAVRGRGYVLLSPDS